MKSQVVDANLSVSPSPGVLCMPLLIIFPLHTDCLIDALSHPDVIRLVDAVLRIQSAAGESEISSSSLTDDCVSN